MKLRNIFVFTHDSIGLGEDGPTHQPVEHDGEPAPDPEHGRVAALRYGRDRGGVDRRARARKRRPDQPAAVAAEPAVPETRRRADRGDRAAAATCSSAAAGKPRAVIIATGSEVALAMAAQAELAEAGIAVRVVSMPCTIVFDAQDAA